MTPQGGLLVSALATLAAWITYKVLINYIARRPCEQCADQLACVAARAHPREPQHPEERRDEYLNILLSMRDNGIAPSEQLAAAVSFLRNAVVSHLRNVRRQNLDIPGILYYPLVLIYFLGVTSLVLSGIAGIGAAVSAHIAGLVSQAILAGRLRSRLSLVAESAIAAILLFLTVATTVYLATLPADTSSVLDRPLRVSGRRRPGSDLLFGC